MKAAFEAIGYAYGAVEAVRDVSFEMPEGRITVVIGPSGSGKTTLLLLAAGLLAPASGRVLFDGADMAGRPPERRDVGVVFQSYALFPHLTVAENIAFGLTSGRNRLGRAEVARRVEETAALVSVTPLLPRTPPSLSGGEQQRVAVARAIATRPGLLLLDEPLSAIDAMLRRALREELASLLRRIGITTLYVTHDQEEALFLADRLVVLREGRVEQEGAPLEAYRRPRTRFVASFLGDANLVPAVVEGTDPATGRARVRTALGTADVEANGIAPKARGTLVLRPEDLEAGTEGIPATVIEARGLGPYDRVTARVAADVELTLRVAPGASPLVGASIRVAPIAGRGHFLPD
ncbi:MAG TPA: ABC transporter ATP-binding protein [Candidatus Eisenbacteria bacterium]